MTVTPTYVGIDVAKNRLDIAMRPSGECQQVGNDERGIRYVAQIWAIADSVDSSSSKRPVV